MPPETGLFVRTDEPLLLGWVLILRFRARIPSPSVVVRSLEPHSKGVGWLLEVAQQVAPAWPDFPFVPVVEAPQVLPLVESFAE